MQLHDGSHILLKKLGADYDPGDRMHAMELLETSRNEGHLVTGLLYLNEDAEDFAGRERLPETPLRDLGEAELRLSPDDFARVMEELA